MTVIIAKRKNKIEKIVLLELYGANNSREWFSVKSILP